MPRRLRMQEEFESYRREVIPVNAPMAQIVECRRAFYAGAQAFRALCCRSPNDPAGEARFLLELEQELDDFPKRELAQGHGAVKP